MKRPFDTSKLQAMLPYDGENDAWRLRPDEYKDLVKNYRFLSFLKEMVEEAKSTKLTLEQMFNLHSSGMVKSNLLVWEGYHEFLNAVKWLFSDDLTRKK